MYNTKILKDYLRNLDKINDILNKPRGLTKKQQEVIPQQLREQAEVLEKYYDLKGIGIYMNALLDGARPRGNRGMCKRALKFLRTCADLEIIEGVDDFFLPYNTIIGAFQRETLQYNLIKEHREGIEQAIEAMAYSIDIQKGTEATQLIVRNALNKTQLDRGGLYRISLRMALLKLEELIK